MTTIIAKDKCLIADRRVVVNAIKQGIIGVRDAIKIKKLPYCIYGISGFERSPEVGGYSTMLFDNSIATLCALNYLCVGKSDRQKVIMEGTGWTEKMYDHFRNKARKVFNAVGKEFATKLFDHGQSVIITTHDNILLFQNGSITIAEHSEIVVMGSGSKTAHILLDHSVPIEEVYSVLRSSGMPTGAVIDKLCLSDLDEKLVPNLRDPYFAAMIANSARSRIKKEISMKILPADMNTKVKYIAVDVIATLLTIGQVKNKRWYYSKKAVADWRDVIAIANNGKAIKIACDLMEVNEAEYILSKEKAAP